MEAEEYVTEAGKWIGTDGKPDGKCHVVPSKEDQFKIQNDRRSFKRNTPVNELLLLQNYQK